MSKEYDALEKAAVKVSSAAEVLWEPMGGTPVYPELADLCMAVMDMREALVGQSEAERDVGAFDNRSEWEPKSLPSPSAPHDFEQRGV